MSGSISSLYSIYPFALDFDGEAKAAVFPFIVDEKPVTALAGSGGKAPACLVSGRAAGNMALPGAPQRGMAKEPGGLSFHGEEREAFFRTRGIPPDRVYSLVQEHSRNVRALYGTETPAAFVQKGDGIVSFAPDAYPAVTVADCLPVFLLDTERGFFAALHSGWKGTGIVVRAVALMQEAGTRPEALAAVLGPCIQSCCYRVDQEHARDFQAEFGGAGPGAVSGGLFPKPVSLYREGAAYLDLQAANIRLLAASGVRHIACCTDCTFTDERLGSYRREGPAAYTRMIAMAGLL